MHSTHRFHEVTRRHFLKVSLVAAGTVATMSLINTHGMASDGMVFKGADMVALEAITDTILPAGGAYEQGAKDVHLAKRIDTFMAAGDADVSLGLLGAVRFVENTLPTMVKNDGLFSVASLDDRTYMFRHLLTIPGDPRQIFLGLRNISFLAYYTDETSWPMIGYDGPLV